MIRVLTGGNGPALLLLHGDPETHVTWHKIAPSLAQQYTVVLPDLRCYGDSSKPDGGPEHSNYSFRAMAQDQIELMDQLGHKRFMVAGHDRRGRVAHRLCLDHAKAIETFPAEPSAVVIFCRKNSPRRSASSVSHSLVYR